jgi:hypothetical protein
MGPRILMFYLFAGAKNVLGVDIHSHIPRIRGIAKPIANPPFIVEALERLVTSPTIPITVCGDLTTGEIANIALPTRIALYDNVS